MQYVHSRCFDISPQQPHILTKSSSVPCYDLCSSLSVMLVASCEKSCRFLAFCPWVAPTASFTACTGFCGGPCNNVLFLRPFNPDFFFVPFVTKLFHASAFFVWTASIWLKRCLLLKLLINFLFLIRVFSSSVGFISNHLGISSEAGIPDCTARRAGAWTPASTNHYRRNLIVTKLSYLSIKNISLYR